MKLIDLLVKELPKHGGWPEGIGKISMHANGTVYRDGSKWVGALFGLRCSDGWHHQLPSTYTNAVTREQYEAALAASELVVWGGDGLPPVGCACEVKRAIDWMSCKILFISEYHVVLRGEEEYCWQTQACQFRPIRTEAERKREEAIKQMMECSAVLVEATAGLIYDAIAAGKIPHITL